MLRFKPLYVLLFSVIVGLSLCGCARKDSKRAEGARGQPTRQPVEVAAIERRDLTERLNLVGSFAPNESAQMKAEIAGQVRAIYFNEGERVEKGQVLLKIDDSELQAQLAQSEARFRLAELNLQRAESLKQSKTTTPAEYDRVSAEFATAKAEQSLLKVRVEKTEVKAPFAGIAGSRSISPGDYVNSSSVITTIHDLSRIKVEFQVPETYLAKVHPGTVFEIGAWKDGAKSAIGGEVYFVNAVIERSTRSSEVKGYVDNPPATLKAGMFANIELVLDVRKGVLTVPEGAVLNTPQGTQIIVVKGKADDASVDYVPVALGLRTKGLVEVRPLSGGLEAGQNVVASGVGAVILFPGAKIEMRPLRPEFRPGE